MDLHMLRQFLVVARLEHLSRAAEELRVAQPSLSRTIARLEGELGTPLFDRGGRLRLNDVGRLFRGHVERALGELDAGTRAVAEAAGEGFGAVRLASETFLTITGPLTAFKRAHPDSEVVLHQMTGEEMGRRLRAQDIDLCVASQPIVGDGLESARLLDEPVWLCTPADHPLAGRDSVGVEELAGYPFVSSRKGHWQRRLLDRVLASRDLTPKIVCEGDEPSALAFMIAVGLGLGLVPDIARRTVTGSAVAWVAVEDPDCRRVLTLHWGSGSYLSPAARVMRDTIIGWDWAAEQPESVRVA